MKKINTVTGAVESEKLGVTLSHEHMMCLYKPMAEAFGKMWFDRERVVDFTVRHLKDMKEHYGINTVVDATTLNLGRDISLLKEISERSEVYILLRDFTTTMSLWLTEKMQTDLQRSLQMNVLWV